jgi:hypothetical protein
VANLDADRRRVFGKRQELGAKAGGPEGGEQPLGLGLLAALIESFEGNQVP